MQGWRSLLAGVAALGLFGCATAPEPSPAPPAGLAAPVWPHETADLAPDPAARFGMLDNGMRYQIQRNTQPAGVAAFRLRIAAGSLQEEDDQEGFAHFLEHMAFNGSKNVPEGEMIKLLERQGLAFGPDTNAYTSFGETVYQLDLPDTDQDTLDTAFLLLREIGDRLTLAQDAIEREKGVILAEERARDTPESRIFERRFGFWLKDQRLPTRYPIGKVEDIKGATAARMRAFYEAYYRPERSFLAIVGDIDPEAIEARIKASFGDWRAEGSDPADPGLGAVAARSAEADLIVEPKGPTTLTVAWTSPPDRRPDLRAARAEETRRAVALAVINRRLERIARGADAPFIAASVSHDQVQKSATLAALNVNAQPARWRGALAAAEQELRRALEHGVQPGELAREISEYRAALEAAAAGVATRDSRALANEAVAAVDNDWVFTDPKLELELFNAAVEGYGAEAATAAIRSSFAGQGPLVFLSAGSAPEGGAAGVLEAFNQSRAMPVKPPPAEKQVAFDYAFGTPGAITARRTVESLGVHMATFANGVKLTVKQTPFEQGRIRAAVRVEGGYRTLGPVKPGLNWALPFAVAEAGVGKLDREDLDRATTGRVVGLDIDLDDDAFTYQGATRPADLDLQLGVLAAHVVDPGWRGEGLARLQDFAQTQFQQLSSSPGRVFGRDGPALLRAGDARWQFPTLDQARALTMADVKAALAPGLARAPIEVILVGDVTPAAAEEAVARTFGALPARARQAPGLSRNVVFPKAAGETMRLAHAGRADQALAFVAFDAADLRVARLARAERFVSEMMQLRLTEEVREKLGASYSPNTVHAASRVFQDYGYVAASAEVEPAQIDPIFALIEVVAADLREGRFDDDLVARARAPLVEQVRTAEKSNSYWLGALERLHDDAGLAAAIETRAKDFETLTREELVAAARRVFAPGAPRLKAAVIPAQ